MVLLAIIPSKYIKLFFVQSWSVIFNLWSLNNRTLRSFTECIFVLADSVLIYIILSSTTVYLLVLWFAYENPLELLLLWSTWLQYWKIIWRIVAMPFIRETDVFILWIIWVSVYSSCALFIHTLLRMSRPYYSTIVRYLLFLVVVWIRISIPLPSLTNMHTQWPYFFILVSISHAISIMHHFNGFVNFMDVFISSLVFTFLFFFVSCLLLPHLLFDHLFLACRRCKFFLLLLSFIL